MVSCRWLRNSADDVGDTTRPACPAIPARTARRRASQHHETPAAAGSEQVAGSRPRVRMASISSRLFIVPICAVNALAVRPARRIASASRRIRAEKRSLVRSMTNSSAPKSRRHGGAEKRITRRPEAQQRHQRQRIDAGLLHVVHDEVTGSARAQNRRTRRVTVRRESRGVAAGRRPRHGRSSTASTTVSADSPARLRCGNAAGGDDGAKTRHARRQFDARRLETESPARAAGAGCRRNRARSARARRSAVAGPTSDSSDWTNAARDRSARPGRAVRPARPGSRFEPGSFVHRRAAVRQSAAETAIRSCGPATVSRLRSYFFAAC